MSDAASLKFALSELPLASLSLCALPDPNISSGFMDGDAWAVLFHASLTCVTRLEVRASSPLMLSTSSRVIPVLALNFEEL